MSEIAKGKFITIEGCDGSGKTTQAQLIANELNSKNITTYVTREVGGVAFAEKIRALMFDNNLDNRTLILLAMAARVEHIKHTIIPKLQAGVWVICDRFIDSTACYHGDSEKTFFNIYTMYYDLLLNIMPDITFFLDVKPEIAVARLNNRAKKNKIDQRDIQYHTQIYRNFKKAADFYNNRIISIDANTDNMEYIKNKICSYLIENNA